MRLTEIQITPIEVRLTNEEILADLLYPEAPAVSPAPRADR